MTRLVLGNDAAWGGWGWCLATDTNGPIEVGWCKLGQRAWREADLRAYLDELDGRLAEAALEVLSPGDPSPRVVVEKAPKVYSGRGNQSVIGFGMGEVHGALKVHFARPDLAYPWSVMPDEWRPWWGLTGKRADVKRAAVHLVRRSLKREDLLEPWWDTDPDGPLGDVAEAVLIAYGAAQRFEMGPKGPRGWRR